MNETLSNDVLPLNGSLNHDARFAVHLLRKHYPEPPVPPEDGCRWVVTSGDRVRVKLGPDPTIFVDTSPLQGGYPVTAVQYLGHLGSVPCYAADLSPSPNLSLEGEFLGVRALFGRIPDSEVAVAGLAVQILDFDRSTRFCGRCGAVNRQARTERVKCCPQCHQVVYPRLSPAIIVLVRNGASILLVRKRDAPTERFSPIAGFVEPGETIEEAVHREVREEAGIAITHLRYLASEPWPFPNSLMIGFIADYAGGTVTPDGVEIEAACWFDRDHIPASPRTMSIGRSLITWWMSGR